MTYQTQKEINTFVNDRAVGLYDRYNMPNPALHADKQWQPSGDALSKASYAPQISGGKSREYKDIKDMGASPPCVNFNTGLTVKEINTLRDRLQENMAFMNIHKHCIKPQEYNDLINHHYYSLSVLDNMINIKIVEHNNPYEQNALKVGVHKASNDEVLNPFQPALRAVYDDQGKIRVMDAQSCHSDYKQEWEQQFDSVLMNPHQYTIPPNNVWKSPSPYLK